MGRTREHMEPQSLPHSHILHASRGARITQAMTLAMHSTEITLEWRWPLGVQSCVFRDHTSTT
eukprot:3742952-Pyramimonas_sp.AAC.1